MPQVLIGLVFVGFGIETFPADEDQIGETAFLYEQSLIPFAVIVVEGKGNMILFAIVSELGFVTGDHFSFVVFQLQEGGDVIAGAGGGQGGMVDGAKEQSPGVYPLVFDHGLQKGERTLGKLLTGVDDKYLFHIEFI